MIHTSADEKTCDPESSGNICSIDELLHGQSFAVPISKKNRANSGVSLKQICKSNRFAPLATEEDECDNDSCSAVCEQGICLNRPEFEDWELDEIEVFGDELTKEAKINILLQLKASRRSNPWPDELENSYSEHPG